jgi:hypothetical protein
VHSTKATGPNVIADLGIGISAAAAHLGHRVARTLSVVLSAIHCILASAKDLFAEVFRTIVAIGAGAAQLRNLGTHHLIGDLIHTVVEGLAHENVSGSWRAEVGNENLRLLVKVHPKEYSGLSQSLACASIMRQTVSSLSWSAILFSSSGRKSHQA